MCWGGERRVSFTGMNRRSQTKAVRSIERQLKTGSTDPDAPLYENHWPSAQRVWEQLHDKHLLKETTRQEPDGRQLHVELGQAEEGVYLYCANTLDQRQLVIVEPARTVMLESYYQEIASSAP